MHDARGSQALKDETIKVEVGEALTPLSPEILNRKLGDEAAGSQEGPTLQNKRQHRTLGW